MGNFRKVNDFVLRSINIKKLSFIRFFYRVGKLCFESKSYQSFLRDFSTNYKVLIKKDKDTYIDYFGFKLYGYLGLLTSMKEKNEYYKLKDSKCVLDLGGFIGDSALEIISNSKKVYVFEPQNENFEYILKNIKENNLSDKIFPYNYLVKKENNREQEKLYGGSFKGRTTSIHIDCFAKNSFDKVDVMSIKEVLNLANFDAVKIDIEGGEFEIIEFFLNNEKDFKFDKGVIEFHFSNGDKSFNLKTFKEFISLLNKKNYSYHLYKSIEPDVKFDLRVFENVYPMSGCLCYFKKM